MQARLRPLALVSVLASAAGLAAPAAAQTTWTDWTSTTPLSAAPEVVGGVLGGVTVTYVGQLDPGALLNPTFNYWNSHLTTYTSPLVPTSPPLGDLLRLTGGPNSGEHVITFSQPVADPVMAVLSLGTPNFSARYEFTTPYVLENAGPGAFGNGTLTVVSTTVLEGREGNGLLRFPGVHTELRFRTPVSESWSGFTLGRAATVGVRSCSGAVANSTGQVAIIAAAGSTVVAEDGLWLAAGRLPANTFGYFLCSRTPGQVPHAGGSQGTLCLGGAVGRFNGTVTNSGPFGSFGMALNLDLMPTPTGTIAALPGETWHFQCWFRDAVNGTTTSNFTDSVIVALQ